MQRDREALPSKVVEFGGGLTMRIPVDWTHGPLDQGGWWCGELDRSVAVNLYPDLVDPIESDDGRPATPTMHALREVEDIKTNLAAGMVGDVSVTPIQSGFILHATARTVLDEVAYRDVRWYAISPSGRRLRSSLCDRSTPWGSSAQPGSASG